MADENGDVKGVDLEDSNMANYGSKEHKDARKAAAESEKEFVVRVVSFTDLILHPHTPRKYAIK